MRLSEAIRVGARMRAASERGWNDAGPDGQIRTCALVAAAEGAGLFTIVGNCVIPGPNWLEPLKGDAIARDEAEKPCLKSRMPDNWHLITSSIEAPPCPCGKFGVKDLVMVLIWHLHDVHAWSREAVAEWIETLERAFDERIAGTEALRLALVREETMGPQA